MAAKGAKVPLGGTHTAGIYADMTVDGPEIGTLVVVVDRAKNLPNRKTMGKQDPYCAARLGKEAKKTETDKRGGQTPRWDQELRFTVHESPDYYQLKVSVFNDDKKTDLIGETWLDLKAVVIPGGGQNDLWHGLQYKGKYAGDIRIELTYYDTRPQDEAVIEKRRESERNEVNGTVGNGLSGPRQPNPVKRRPLPADPTGSSPLRPGMPDQVHSSPLPYASQLYDNPHETTNHWTPEHMNQGMLDSPDPNYQICSDDNLSYEDTYNPSPQAFMPLPQDYMYPSSEYEDQDMDRRTGQFSRSPPERFGYGHDQYDDHSGGGYNMTPGPRQKLRHALPSDGRRYSAQPSFPSQMRETPYSTPSSHRSSPLDLPILPQTRSAPGSGNHGERSRQAYHRYSTSPLKNDVFRDSPLRQTMSNSEFNPRYGDMQPSVVDEEPPPPPPAHRNNTGYKPFQKVQSYNDMAPMPIPMPAPLNIPQRMSGTSPTSQSPLGQYYPPYDQDRSTVSPTTERGQSQSGHSVSSQTSYSQQRPRGHSQDYPAPSTGEPPMPPSLVAGYDPSIAEAETERGIYEKHMSGRMSIGPTSLPGNQQPYSHRPGDSPFRSTATMDDRSTSRAAAPMVKPRAVSPDPRSTVPRKSVSPQPVPAADERRLSGIPFGPDSYDTLNPNAGSATAVHPPNSHYETPEQAKETARQREVEKLRGQGPIIGNDGRVIDPSDHLPTDTWAPEPERKQPKKPEVVIRFKHAPRGGSPAPSPASHGSSPTTAPRPHSIATPIYAHSSPATPQSFESPVSAGPLPRPGRNRLQKPNSARPLPTQPYSQQHQQHPHSSPIVPTMQNTPSPRSNLPPRNSVSEFPLREHENYGNGYSYSYNSSSPTYPRNSPFTSSGGGGPPPPIPAKIPIHPGNQNYPSGYGGGGMDALSEEMRRIDIGGSGVGGRGPRRVRGYGGVREV